MFGIWPLWAHRDLLCLRYWSYLVNLPSDRIMTSVFRERADAVDLNLRDARGSILRRYKQLLLQYDLEEFWRSRSVLRTGCLLLLLV